MRFCGNGQIVQRYNVRILFQVFNFIKKCSKYISTGIYNGDDVIGKYHSGYQKCYFPVAGAEVEIPGPDHKLPETPQHWTNCQFLVDDYEEFGFIRASLPGRQGPGIY